MNSGGLRGLRRGLRGILRGLRGGMPINTQSDYDEGSES